MTSNGTVLTVHESAARVQTADAARLLGVSARTVQYLAGRGELPGAAKIGQTWTFCLEKLRRFVAAQESICATKKTYIKEAASGGCAPRSGAENAAKAYELAMSKARGGYATRGLRNSAPRSGMASATGLGSKL
jgi:hypothetical protein